MGIHTKTGPQVYTRVWTIPGKPQDKMWRNSAYMDLHLNIYCQQPLVPDSHPGTNILRSFTAGWSASLSCLCVHLLMINPKLFSAIYAWNILSLHGQGWKGGIDCQLWGGWGRVKERTDLYNKLFTDNPYIFHSLPHLPCNMRSLYSANILSLF